MKQAAKILGYVTMLALAACSSSPTVTFYTLENGVADLAGRHGAPSIVITRTTVPDLLDRPQLVSRTGSQVQLSEQSRWAEPLQRQIPRVFADELGKAVNSSQVFASPSAAQRSEADFRLQLEVLRLELVSSQMVDADIRWRLESRQGVVSTGRSTLQEPAGDGSVAASVAAQRRALARVAALVAADIARLGASDKPSTH